MKQGFRVIDHHREETLVVEGLCLEVEGNEDIFGALHVVSGHMGHGIVLTIDQQPNKM